ncbi:MAG TPA: 4-(cytidine 5'-diphospho)-2-C-methyl-D-erythritol kinase [Steroidobacteraceae bacterium]
MSPAQSVWRAPAKLNLFLHILGRRPDGYHQLQTCFQFVDLCDEITLEVRADGQIRRAVDIPDLPAEADLCIRAARALKDAAGTTLGADIHLLKRIPIGGGLGGGSSDAATCLVALNQLWGIHWPPEKLAALGLKLGADVPVFVHGRAAWAEGVGERLTPLYASLAPPEPNYLILKPNVFVSTAAVFQDPELTRNSAPITIHGFLASGGRNDCLEVVRRRYPEVACAIDWLSSFGTARLTGTGACVFMVCEPAQARRILTHLPAGCEGFSARGLNASPLLSRLAASGAGAV